MSTQDVREETPGLDGPDYVALVIEWEDDDAATLVRAKEPSHAPIGRTIAAIAGALIALGVATWGLHRLHTS
jgi:hypothetical protein